MSRIRSLVFGFLLLMTTVAGIEYGLRESFISQEMFSSPAERTARWQPDAEIYWTTTKTEISSDQSDAPLLAPKPRPIVFGSELLMSRDSDISPLVLAWKEQFSDAQASSPEIVDLCLPQGCPLLWQVQLESRFSSAQFGQAICILNRHTSANDYWIRRGTEFDDSGRPIKSQHPHFQVPALSQESEENQWKPRLILETGFPAVVNLFFGESPRDPINTHERKTTLEDRERTLQPLTEIQKWIQPGGLTLILLPDFSELKAIKNSRNAQLTVDNNSGTDQQSLIFQQSVKEYATRYGLRLVDFSDVILQDESPERFYDSTGMHLSAAGYQKLAETVSNLQSAQQSLFSPVVR